METGHTMRSLSSAWRAAALSGLALCLAAIGCRGEQGGKAGEERKELPTGEPPYSLFSPGEALEPKCKFVDPPPAESARHYAKSYRFSKDWFTPNVPIWEKALAGLKGKPGVNYLEVGLFEGRSAIWMLENILTHPDSRLTGIDIFPPGLKEVWLYNLQLSGYQEKATTITGYSRHALRKLPLNSFDVVYIDGSHTADDIITDMTLSWDLLKPGGILIVDDYLLRPALDYPDELRPRAAVDSFVTAYRNYVEVVHRCYQIILRKIDNPCEASKWDCSPIGEYLYRWPPRKLVSRQTDRPIPLTEEENALLQRIIKSRRFGEKRYHLDREIRNHPAFASLKEKLKLEL